MTLTWGDVEVEFKVDRSSGSNYYAELESGLELRLWVAKRGRNHVYGVFKGWHFDTIMGEDTAQEALEALRVEATRLWAELGLALGAP